jgi:hypothetical protein
MLSLSKSWQATRHLSFNGWKILRCFSSI